jgi:hypothetical protein
MNARVMSLTRGVAAHGLPGTERARVLPPTALTPHVWSSLLRDVATRRLTGHLVDAVQTASFATTGEQREAALRAHECALASDLLVERRLLDAVELLDGAAIPVRILKGAAVAHTVYPRPGLRSFGDVDLLVSSERFDDAIRLLAESGARRRFEEPRKGFDRRFGKGVCMETPDGFELDVHRTFVAGPFGLAIETRDLFGPGAAFTLGGTTLFGLDPELRFVQACFQAALGDAQPRLVALRDVAQMLLCRDLDHHRLRSVVSRWRCGIVLRRAVRLTWSELDLGAQPIALQWLENLMPTSFERRALRCYMPPRRSYASQAVAGLHAVRGPRAKTDYARSLLLPRRSYLATRDGTYRRRFRRGLRLAIADWTRR